MKLYQESKELTVQLFGFCLYLLFITAARNETIRTLEFTQFHEVKTESKIDYHVELYAS